MMMMMYQDLSMVRWVLQWSHQDEEDGATHGSQCRRGLSSAEPAA